MIIDQLPLLQGDPIDDDEFPVERGVTTYKTKLQAFAAAVLSKLVKDATPTQGSTNPVQSGGVYDALQTVQAAAETAQTTAETAQETADTAVSTGSQTLTATVDSVTITAKFRRLGGLVQVVFSATGTINTGWGWQSLMTGLDPEFQPNAYTSGSICQAPSAVQGIAVRGKNDSAAGEVLINMANTSGWLDGSFAYII